MAKATQGNPNEVVFIGIGKPHTPASLRRAIRDADRRAERRAIEREARKAWILRKLQDVVYAHAPANDFHTGADDNRFTIADIVGNADTADQRIAVKLLKLAEKSGAIRAGENGTWIAVDDEKLY